MKAQTLEQPVSNSLMLAMLLLLAMPIVMANCAGGGGGGGSDRESTKEKLRESYNSNPEKYRKTWGLGDK